MKKELLLIFFIGLLIIIFLIYKNCNQVEFFEYDSNIKGPQVLIIGGTHGNEPAGTFAIQEIKRKIISNKIKIKKGKVILIPEVNSCGLRLGIRWNIGNIFYPDINRNYPTSKEGNGRCYISDVVKTLADSSDFILDLHEGYDYHHKNLNSIGSTLSPNPTKDSEIISEKMKILLNKDIKEDYKKFKVIQPNERKIIKGTLSEYCKNKNYILIETTGQWSIQPLETRLKQMEKTIITLLSNLKVT